MNVRQAELVAHLVLTPLFDGFLAANLNKAAHEQFTARLQLALVSTGLLRLCLHHHIGQFVVEHQFGQEHIEDIIAGQALRIEDIDELVTLLALFIDLLAYLAVQPYLRSLALLALQQWNTELTVNVAVVKVALDEGKAYAIYLE